MEEDEIKTRKFVRLSSLNTAVELGSDDDDLMKMTMKALELMRKMNDSKL